MPQLIFNAPKSLYEIFLCLVFDCTNIAHLINRSAVGESED